MGWIVGVCALGVSVLLAACGDDDDNADKNRVGRDVTETTESRGSFTTAPDDGAGNIAAPGNTWAASVKAEVPEILIYDSADATAPAQTLPGKNEYGTPVVFLVDGQDANGARLPVFLPTPPNGSKGWIDASAVDLVENPYRITVQLAAHRLVLTKGSETVVDTTVAVGRAGRETPVGVYFLTELMQPPDAPNGDYGAYAYGLSAEPTAEAAAEFGDDAPVGIHGTNQPEKLGTDVSSGCIRMSNESISELAALLPLGTPVEILA